MDYLTDRFSSCAPALVYFTHFTMFERKKKIITFKPLIYFVFFHDTLQCHEGLESF